MLLNLHVKNLALIEEADIDFNEGLHILSGETGAGKSILIGSINLALGGKVSKDIIRNGAEYGLVELVFQTESKDIKVFFERNDFPWEEGQIIISRKLMNNKNITKINGETISVSMLKELSALLIDIHGQHDNESLLKTSKHLAMLDGYGGSKVVSLKERISKEYTSYRKLKEKFQEFNSDEESRIREMSFLEFEIKEIEQASLQMDEDEKLEEEYKLISNAERVTREIGEVYSILDEDDGSIRGKIGKSVKILNDMTRYDERIQGLYQSMSEIEALMNDLTREISGYMADISFDEERFEYVENRLNLINKLKLKYGKSISEILVHKEAAEKKLDFYHNFEQEKIEIERLLSLSEKELTKLCDELTNIRKEASISLKKKIVKTLNNLNFLEVRFEVEFQKNNGFSPNGNDAVQFLISTNPGEGLQPLSKVASGGELSRIMLGFKTILAGKDNIETLIFDEIDTGISGRTAQLVSERLKEISRSHQVICITHLPQIASMADNHYLIEKTVKNSKTITNIKKLSDEKSVEELARMLGGVEITDTVMESAREMKKMANQKQCE